MVVEIAEGTVHHIVVAVDEDEVFAPGQEHAGVARGGESAVLLGDDIDEVGVLPLIVCQNLAASVGRAVVHTDNLILPSLHSLAQQGVEATRKEFLHVIDGNDDGQFH